MALNSGSSIERVLVASDRDLSPERKSLLGGVVGLGFKAGTDGDLGEAVEAEFRAPAALGLGDAKGDDKSAGVAGLESCGVALLASGVGALAWAGMGSFSS